MIETVVSCNEIEDIDSIKHKILEYYSRRFEDDFQNYPTNMLDKIDYEFRNLDLEKLTSLGNELMSKTLELVKDVKSLFKEKLQISLTKDELRPEIRKHLSLISTKIIGLKERIKELTLNHYEAEFNAAIKFCDEHASELGESGKPLKNCLTTIYYLLDHFFCLCITN